jgi:5-methylcytosine-specific restriction protein A
VLVRPAGRCDSCKRAKWKQQDQWRGNASQRLYTAEWRKQSTYFLRAYPVCYACERAATVVDHHVPHKGDYSVFWDRTNWRSMCKPCHDHKTAVHDGAFGNAVTPAGAVSSPLLPTVTSDHAEPEQNE